MEKHKATEKLLKEIIQENKVRAPQMVTETKTVQVQRLKLVRDGSIKYQVPRAPVTSPEHCLDIFRTHFKGADREIVAVLSLNSQNQYLAVTNVAWGSISHVVVQPREVFKAVLAKDNAAAFILAHNHPSGDPTPSPEDYAMLDAVRDLGIKLDCRLRDFIIIGDGTNEYYSHREQNYDL